MTKASVDSTRISAQKCRLVADLIRGLKVGLALTTLRFCRKKAAKILLKLLQSAIANADHNSGLDIDKLIVKTICINKGSSLKRMMPRAKGRGNRIEKQTSNIEIILDVKK